MSETTLSETGYVKTIKDGPVAQVVLSRPEHLNSWLTGQQHEISAAFDDLDEDEEVKVIVFIQLATKFGRQFGPMDPGEKPPPDWELMLEGYNQILEDDRKLSYYNITPATRRPAPRC